MGSDEEVVCASEVRKLEARIRELGRQLRRKTLEVEILKEALDNPRSRMATPAPNAPVCRGVVGPTIQDALTTLHLKTARAYQIRLAFQEIYQQPTRGWGALFLDRWYAWAIRSRLEPIKHAARCIKRHRDGILAWFDSHIANGLIEGINSLVQAAKAKARGYRSTRTLRAITYLIAGKLDLRLPT